MSAIPLEDRVAALEKEVEKLKRLVKGGAKKDWLDQIVGSFANDPLYEEAMQLGREYRESLRPKPKNNVKRGKPRKR
jgi:hypothetical protein